MFVLAGATFEHTLNDAQTLRGPRTFPRCLRRLESTSSKSGLCTSSCAACARLRARVHEARPEWLQPLKSPYLSHLFPRDQNVILLSPKSWPSTVSEAAEAARGCVLVSSQQLVSGVSPGGGVGEGEGTTLLEVIVDSL